jgi:sulfate permease, SulP family
MAGVAVSMIASQLEKVTGIPVDGNGLVSEISSFARNLDDVHWPTVALSAGLLGLLYLLQWRFPRTPGPLVVVIVGAVLVSVFSLSDAGISVVGEVPAGLPVPAIPDVHWSDLAALLLPAVGIAIVGYTDNVLTGRAFGLRQGQRVDANAEFAALSAANIAAGLLQGFPVSSSGSRTALGEAMGSRSQLYSLITLACVVLTLLLAGPLLASFPSAALGALVIYAAVRLIEVSEIRRIGHFRRSELLLAVGTTVAVLLLGVLYGVLVAVALSIVDLVRRVARPHDGILGYVPGLAGMHDVDDYENARQIPGLVVYRYDAPLCFANAEDFGRRALAAVDESADPVEWFVLNAEANVEIDITAADALEQLRADLVARGVIVALARVKQDLRHDLDAAGLIASIGADRVFPTLPTAVIAFLTDYRERHGSLPPGVRMPIPPADPLEAHD